MRTTRVAALILAVGLTVLPAGLAVAQPTPGAGRNWCRSTRRRRLFGAATGDCEVGRVSARHKPRQVTELAH
jgi:hypothetical protein